MDSHSFEHVYDSAIAIGDNASANRISGSAGGLRPEVRRELEALLETLAGHEGETDETARWSAAELKSELSRKEPSLPWIRRLLSSIAAGAAGAETIVDLVTKIQRLIGH